MTITIEINRLNINLEANFQNSNWFVRYWILNSGKRQFLILAAIIIRLRTALISFITHRTKDDD